MNLVFTRYLADRLAAFKRLQRNPKLEIQLCVAVVS